MHTLKHLLSKLPHKKQVRFAVDCVLDVKHLLIDPRSLKVLEITALWLEDKATRQEVSNAYAAAAYAADTDADYNACDADYAAYYASNAVADVYAAYYAADYAVYAASYAAKVLDLPIEHYYTKLVNSLTEVEKVIYDIKE